MADTSDDASAATSTADREDSEDVQHSQAGSGEAGTMQQLDQMHKEEVMAGAPDSTDPASASSGAAALATPALEPASSAAAAASAEEPYNLRELLSKLQARSEADSQAAQKRLLSASPAAHHHTAHSSYIVKSASAGSTNGSVAALQDSLASLIAADGTSDSTANGPIELQLAGSSNGAAAGAGDMPAAKAAHKNPQHQPPSASSILAAQAEWDPPSQPAAAGGDVSCEFDEEDGWTPAANARTAIGPPLHRTPRETGASQASTRNEDGSRRGSQVGQASCLPEFKVPRGGGGWTPRAAFDETDDEIGNSQSPRYPRVDYSGAEAARSERQRLQTINNAHSASVRRLGGSASRQLFRAPQGVARRQSRPSSGGGRSGPCGGSNGGGSIGGGSGVGSGDGQRPKSGGRARGRRWSVAAPPGVQLYGRVHTWKEENKQWCVCGCTAHPFELTHTTR